MKWHQLLAMTILAQPLVMAGAYAQQAGAQAGGAGAQQSAAVAAQQVQGGGGGQGGGRGGMAEPKPVGDEFAYPAGIAIAKSKMGPVFVDTKGMTLYQPNLRFLQQLAFGGGGGGDPVKFCKDVCTTVWKAVAAPADAKPTGYWKVVEGAQGPQWAYKNSPVFTYTLDKGPGDTSGDGADEAPTPQTRPQVWKAVVFIPPMPKIMGPGNVAPLFAGGEYVLTDLQHHPLSMSSTCGESCRPFTAGMASQSVGEWTVVRDGDRPQWAYHGKPVYVSEATLVPLAPQAPTDSATLRP